MRAVLLLALVGALLVSGSAAGPIRPVAAAKPSAKPENEYVFVKLLFDGHDQPNFDRWHANATAATVAKAGGVPVNYLIRLVDGRLPGTKETAPVAKPILAQSVPAAPVTVTKPAAPVTATTPVAVTTPVQVATPAPAAAAPAPTAAAPAPATAVTAPAPAATTAPSVTLIQAGAAKPAEPEQKAVQTKPESGEGDLAAPAVPTTPAPQSMGLWETVQNALTSNRAARQTQPEAEPVETPVTGRPNVPRVFVIGGRKLFSASQITPAQLAPNQAMVEYAIRTNASEPWAVRETVKRKLMASAANFGMAQGTSLKGFYTLLKENGVGYYPAMWVDGEQILTGEVAMEAPANRFVNGSKDTKNFQHKLYKHTDLVKPKVPVTKNVTNATVAEPSFVMANRSTSTSPSSSNSEAPHKRGIAPWVAALIALGAIAVALAVAGTVWRCAKDRRARRAEEDAAHSEPLSPHSVVSHSGM